MSIKEKKTIILIASNFFVELKKALQIIEPTIMRIMMKSRDSFLGRMEALVGTAKA